MSSHEVHVLPPWIQYTHELLSMQLGVEEYSDYPHRAYSVSILPTDRTIHPSLGNIVNVTLEYEEKTI